jgi:hypothetical protein
MRGRRPGKLSIRRRDADALHTATQSRCLRWFQVLRTKIVSANAQILDHWKRDNDLAGIREPEALAKLPEAEQKEWQALWAEVKALLKRAQGQTRATP